jgi:hypothetical protein
VVDLVEDDKGGRAAAQPGVDLRPVREGLVGQHGALRADPFALAGVPVVAPVGERNVEAGKGPDDRPLDGPVGADVDDPADEPAVEQLRREQAAEKRLA